MSDDGWVLEQEKDREWENLAARGIEREFGVFLKRFAGDFVPVDRYAVQCGTTPFVVEFKCRNMAWEDYEDILFSVDKYQKLLKFKGVTPASFYAVVTKHDQRLHILEAQCFDPTKVRYDEYGGRTLQQRAIAPHDIEPSYYPERRAFYEVDFDLNQAVRDQLAREAAGIGE